MYTILMTMSVRGWTGNDLARCLGWGAGMHVIREGGLPGALRDVEHATPVPLDRWDVEIAATPPESKAKGKARGRGGSAAESQNGRKAEVKVS